MSTQHLSDEAVAAFADSVLRGRARERAATHIADCPECAHAVAVQREAVWALRSAPAPALPGGLLDRLREVPATTLLGMGPFDVQPAALDRDGSFLFAAAAFVPDPGRPQAPHDEVGHRSAVARLIDPVLHSFRRS